MHEILLSFITLTFLEIVLGIDNLIFIAIVVAKLPAKDRRFTSAFGLSMALVIRIIMLSALSWVMSLTNPLVQIGEIGISFKDLLLILGGGFLIGKSGMEIYSDVRFGLHAPKEEKKFNVAKNLTGAALQITLIDFVFSFDSIITAVGMTNNIPVMVAAVIVSMILMLIASDKISHFLQTYPSLKIVALSFIFMIGVILLADGIHLHISKAYLYFALFFTIAVESLNIVARKAHK